MEQTVKLADCLEFLCPVFIRPPLGWLND